MKYNSKVVKLALFFTLVMGSFASCSVMTNDCECTQGEGVIDYYDEEVSCSDLEDSADMHCVAK
ncbi:MAG: hypothetical protein MJZ14_08660 [Paludibacteraceae bacterium]|nr:hypothetical protein [Paludibacteraceae bacterium]